MDLLTDNYRFTRHAQEEMLRRQISWELVISILNNPEQIVVAERNRQIYQSRIESNQRQYLVRVITEMTQPLTVVTVYRTSKILKYWEAGDESNI